MERSRLSAAFRRLYRLPALLMGLFRWLFPWAPIWNLWAGLQSQTHSTHTKSGTVPARLVKDRLRISTYGDATRAQRTQDGGCRGCLAEHEKEVCAVCLRTLRSGDRVRVLRNCRHVYHRRCLDRWLDYDEQRTCPLCRCPLLFVDHSRSPQQRRPAERTLASEPSWAVEQLLYLSGDDLLPKAPLRHPSSPYA